MMDGRAAPTRSASLERWACTLGSAGEAANRRMHAMMIMSLPDTCVSPKTVAVIPSHAHDEPMHILYVMASSMAWPVMRQH
jgi:hypothetical protein